MMTGRSRALIVVAAAVSLSGAACGGDGGGEVANETWADAAAEVQFHVDESLPAIGDAAAGSDEQVGLCRAASVGLADVIAANGNLWEQQPPTPALRASHDTLLEQFSALLDSCAAGDAAAVDAAVDPVAAASAELLNGLEAVASRS